MDLKKKDIVFYARVLPTIGIYEIDELKIRTIGENYFVGIEKREKHVYLFDNSCLNKYVFKERSKALKYVKEMEKYKKTISEETYYEEY